MSAPVPLRKNPAAQAVQVVAAVWELNRPAAQSMQSATKPEACALLSAKYRPDSH